MQRYAISLLDAKPLKSSSHSVHQLIHLLVGQAGAFKDRQHSIWRLASRLCQNLFDGHLRIVDALRYTGVIVLQPGLFHPLLLARYTDSFMLKHYTISRVAQSGVQPRHS